jgi:hypothetical protein
VSLFGFLSLLKSSHLSDFRLEIDCQLLSNQLSKPLLADLEHDDWDLHRLVIFHLPTTTLNGSRVDRVWPWGLFGFIPIAIVQREADLIVRLFLRQVLGCHSLNFSVFYFRIEQCFRTSDPVEYFPTFMAHTNNVNRFD